MVILHHGTIVVGNTNRIGPYAVLHTSTCITDTGRNLGMGLSLSTGAKITGGEFFGNHIVVAANSVVTESCPDDNVLLVGMPAVQKKLTDLYASLSEEMKRRVKGIELLKIKL